MNHTTGLFISRLQPAHTGHLSAITQAIESGISHILIGIGSADKERTSNNPFNLEERKIIADALVQTLHQSHPAACIEVHPIMDFGNNTQWKNYIENELPDFDTIITGNPIVKEIWSDKNFFSPSKAQVPYRGTHIRHQLGQADRETIKESVPELVTTALRDIDAPRIIQSINKLQPPVSKIATDLIVMDEGRYVLIRRKYAPHGLALPGGMLDPDETIRECAAREGLEELFDEDDENKGLEISTDYPLWILDNPHRDPRGRIISCVFEAKVTGGSLKGNDDAEEDLVYLTPEQLEQTSVDDFAFGDHRESLLRHASYT